MDFTYHSRTCFPTSHPSTGKFLLDVQKDKIPYSQDIVFLLASTVIYPATFATFAAGEFFISIGLANHQLKSRNAGKKLKKLDTYSDAKIIALSEQRIGKLRRNLQAYEKEHGPLDSSKIDDLSTSYEEARAQWLKNDHAQNWARMHARQWALRRTTKYINMRHEIKAYGDNNSEIAKTILRANYQSAKIRHQLRAKILKHFLKVALTMQLPVVGILICAHSDKTAKDALEEKELAVKYNTLKKEYPFTNNL